MRTRTLMLITVCLLSLSGCALNGYRGVRPEEYPTAKQQFDITVGWKKTIADNGMTIAGYVRNNRYFIIKGLELRVSLVAGDGRERARETFLFIPLELRMEETTPFSVSLRARPQAGDLLRFNYRYEASDDGKHFQTWVNSFEIKALE